MSAEADPADPNRDDFRRSATPIGTDEFAGIESVLGPHSSTRKTYGVPRRFDLATLFSVTIAYALMFGLLRAIRGPTVPPAANQVLIAVVTAFVTCVGAGQAFLFRGRRPRAASIAVGIVIFTALNLFAVFVDGMWRPDDVIFGLLNGIFFGALVGYAAGGAVAGVFLVADAIRKRLPRKTELPGASEEEEPFR